MFVWMWAALGTYMICVSIAAFCARSRLLFAALRQTGRLSLSFVSIPRGSGSPLERSQRPCGYRTLQVHFGIVRFLWRSRRSTTGVRLYEKERRFVLAFLLIWFTFRDDTAGSPLGAARPQTCAKESLTLWTLFMWVRLAQRGALGYNADLAESNLCSGKSCGHTNIPVRAIL